MSTLKKMYKAKEFAPPTKLLESISTEATQIAVQDSSVFSPPPNLATISVGGEGEVVRYGGLEGNILTNVERGIRGEAKQWEAGSAIARRYSSEDHDIFINNIEALDVGLDETTRNFLIARPPIRNCRDINLEAGWHNVDGNTLNTPWSLSSGGLFKIGLPDGRIKHIFHTFASGEIWESIYDTAIEDNGFTQVNGWSHWIQIGNTSGIPRHIIFDGIPLNLLQTIINHLPKNLNESYTLNVLPGTVSDHVNIVQLSGRGSLVINAATARNTFTHNISTLRISSCVNAAIIIRGFTITSPNTRALLLIGNNCNIRTENCNMNTVGATGTGMVVDNSTGNMYFVNCMVSNRPSGAFESVQSQNVFVHNASGTGNGIIYNASWGGTVKIDNEGSITGSNYASIGTGGKVFDSQGREHPRNWHQLTIQNGWDNGMSGGSKYREIFPGVIELQLALTPPDIWNRTVAVLPAGFRPRERIFFPAIDFINGGLNSVAILAEVGVTGLVQIWQNTTGASRPGMNISARIVFSID